MNPSTENSAPTNRRQKRVVSPGFQWRYAMLLAGTVFVTSSILSVVMFAVLHHQARMRLINPQNATVEVGAAMLCFCVGLSGLMAAIVALGSLAFTHRMCGPLTVLKRYFDELSEGRLPVVRRLRRRDEFKELMASFASTVECMEKRRQTAVGALDAVLENARQLVDGRHDGPAKLAEFRRAVDNVRRHLPGPSDAQEKSRPPQAAGTRGELQLVGA